MNEWVNVELVSVSVSISTLCASSPSRLSSVFGCYRIQLLKPGDVVQEKELEGRNSEAGGAQQSENCLLACAAPSAAHAIDARPVRSSIPFQAGKGHCHTCSTCPTVDLVGLPTMAQLSIEEAAIYAHSPVHYAVARRDYSGLHRILANLPRPAKAGEVITETESIAAEERAELISSMVDRRDVPGRETPLHLAVRLGDAVAVEMLMTAGADFSLQNENGWSALQEAVCAREEGIAIIITRHYQPMAWAKWCRRLPRVTATMRRMRDFYMELTFHFESSVIPFIGRIAPSDTYRIWKRGSNLRADMTLAGFDGFKIHRSDQSFLFLGDGSEDGNLPSGSLVVLTHKEKEVTNALEGAGVQPTEAEIAQEVAAMSQTNMFRPGIDVTQAELISHLTWRRQERTEMVGPWKAKIYDMHHVQVSVRSRRVPGAMTDEELFAAEGDRPEDMEDDYGDLLTEEEKRQLEVALKSDNADYDDEGGFESDRPGSRNGGGYDDDRGMDFPRSENGYDHRPSPELNGGNTPLGATPRPSVKEEKKGWFGWGKKKNDSKRPSFSRDGVAGHDMGYEFAGPSSEAMRKAASRKPGKELTRRSADRRPSNFGAEDSLAMRKAKERHSSFTPEEAAAFRKARERNSDFSSEDSFMYRKGKEANRKQAAKEAQRKKKPSSGSEPGTESEYKKGLRPVLWLTPDFPLKSEELLPLLDILANKVKAVRRLRELLTTKLPPGTFPVKVLRQPFSPVPTPRPSLLPAALAQTLDPLFLSFPKKVAPAAGNTFLFFLRTLCCECCC